MERDESSELSPKTIDIIGLGATGQQVARIALGFKIKVLYFSKTRKIEWEEKGIQYLPIDDLLKKSDIISLHVPKNTKIIGRDELEKSVMVRLWSTSARETFTKILMLLDFGLEMNIVFN